jgi:hypothetical protein
MRRLRRCVGQQRRRRRHRASDLQHHHGSLASPLIASQIGRLNAHSDAIEAFRASEQAALAASVSASGAWPAAAAAAAAALRLRPSTPPLPQPPLPAPQASRVMSEIASHVSRIVGDASTEAQRRIERAAAALRDETGSIAGDLAVVVKTQASQVAMASAALTAHGVAFATDAADLKRASASAQETAASELASLASGTRALEAVIGERSGRLAGRWAAFSRDTAAHALETDAATERLTASVKDTAAAASSATGNAAEALCGLVGDAAADFAASVSKAQSDLGERWGGIQEHVDGSVEGLKGHEAAINEFVHTTLRRDTQPDPRPTKYTYPTTFAAMPPYAAVIERGGSSSSGGGEPLVAAWAREESVRSGRAIPGPRTDFPGARVG